MTAGSSPGPETGVPYRIAVATPGDVPALAAMIRALAEYEKLTHLCVGTEAELGEALFGPRPAAEVLIGRVGADPAGFALFFHSFSTFLARPGLWLEDLFVYPRFRGLGLGKALLRTLAGVAADRRCGRFEWAVLDWNAPAIRFYEALGATVMPDWRIARVTGTALDALARRHPAGTVGGAAPPSPAT
jgi:GNAT superfamily N-acetyltransferase